MPALMSFQEQIAARVLAQEARGEPLEGQKAVAQVLKNRLASGHWGHSLAEVCLWNVKTKTGNRVFQFSGWRTEDPNFSYACNLRDDDPMLLHMQQVLSEVMASKGDPTDGAVCYYAVSMQTPPEWAGKMQFCGQFGHQRFYKEAAPSGSGLSKETTYA